MVKRDVIVGAAVIVVFIFFMSNNPSTNTFSIVPEGSGSMGEGALDSTLQNCFDYIDNDDDGTIDLEDPDCLGLGLDDSDGDGFIDIEEYEAGSDIFSADSIPE